MAHGPAIVAIVIILLILLLSCDCLLGPRWRTGPYKEYVRTVSRFGKPSYINKRSNGVAIWSKFPKSCPFYRIMIIDENVPHSKPMPHCDFIYTTIKYHIDPEKLMTVLNISDSIMYDKLKEELTARCHTLEANMATLLLAHDVNNDIVTPQQIATGRVYKKYIMNAHKDAVSNYNMLDSIKNNYTMRDADYSMCNGMENPTTP